MLCLHYFCAALPILWSDLHMAPVILRMDNKGIIFTPLHIFVFTLTGIAAGIHSCDPDDGSSEMVMLKKQKRQTYAKERW